MAEFMQPGQIFIGEPYKDRIAEEFFKGQQAATELTKAEETMRIAQIQREQDQQRIGLEAKRVGLAERQAAQAQQEAARQRAAAQEAGRAGLKSLEMLRQGLTAPAPAAPTVPTMPAASTAAVESTTPFIIPTTGSGPLVGEAPIPTMRPSAAPETPGVAITPPTAPAPSRQVLGVAETVPPTETVTSLPSSRMGMAPSAPTTLGISGVPVEATAPATQAAPSPVDELKRLRALAASTTAPVAQTRQAARDAEQLTASTAAGAVQSISIAGVPVSALFAASVSPRQIYNPQYEVNQRAFDEQRFPVGEVNRRAAARQRYRELRAWASDPKTIKYLSENPNAFAQFTANPEAAYPTLKALPAVVNQPVEEAVSGIANNLVAPTGVMSPEDKGYARTLFERFKPTAAGALAPELLPSNSPLPPSRAIVEAEAFRNFYMDRAAAMYRRMQASGQASEADHKAALDLVTAAANANAVRTNAMLAHGLDMAQQGNTSYLSQVISQTTGTPTQITRDAFGMYTVQGQGLPPRIYPDYPSLSDDLRNRFDATYRAQTAEAAKAARDATIKFNRDAEIERIKKGNPEAEVVKAEDGIYVIEQGKAPVKYRYEPKNPKDPNSIEKLVKVSPTQQ